ncbi:tRNA-specific adenosine deaminase [Thalassocella blandensis]|nr:tRNA-specific adenosine deaminase [Thalassocella blandensis]
MPKSKEESKPILLPSSKDSGKEEKEKPSSQFRDRQSKELVIGLSGPIGCGLNSVRDQLKTDLETAGYEVQIIKLSDLIIKLSDLPSIRSIPGFPSKSDMNSKTRYQSLQKAGNVLRGSYGHDFLAELAVANISIYRYKKILEDDDSDLEDLEKVQKYVPIRRAYIIDQLKHQDEVALLRVVYGNLFYLVGVFSSDEQRKSNLKRGLDLSDIEVAEIMQEDRKGENEFGQQLEKTLKLSDLFIRNTNQHVDRISKQFNRFIRMLHGVVGITPTSHEVAMYVAYSAGLGSACLSRQVGACITDSEGNIMATGCNDVPKAGGGLYSSESAPDSRCVNQEGGICYNDRYKNLLKDKISRVIQEAVESIVLSTEHSSSVSSNDKGEISDYLASLIKSNTELKDLLEYSRSVHAEMDAITTISRKGGGSTRGAYLYTTTYPCHHCARHIIASGIKKVFYIEPYEKSLAKELHRDAIEIDPEEDHTEASYVQFMHFEGVAPTQYQSFFGVNTERKDHLGKLVRVSPGINSKIIAQQLDSYRDMEAKIYDYIAASSLHQIFS